MPKAKVASNKDDQTPTLEVDLDWRSVLTVLGAFVGLVGFTALVRATPRTFTAVAVASLATLALTPVVDAVNRRTPKAISRGTSVVIVLGGLAAGLAAAGALLVPPAIDQARDLSRELPEVADDLGNLPLIGGQLRHNKVPERIETWVEELPQRLSGDTTPLERAGRSLADGLAALVATLLLATTLLLDGPRLVGAARRAIPERWRPRAERLAGLSYEVIGRYVAGSLSVAAVAGIFVLTLGMILRVPLTPLVAAWVALWDLVPQIGGAAGGIPFVLLGRSSAASRCSTSVPAIGGSQGRSSSVIPLASQDASEGWTGRAVSGGC